MLGGERPIMLGEVGDGERYTPDAAQPARSQPPRLERPLEQIARSP